MGCAIGLASCLWEGQACDVAWNWIGLNTKPASLFSTYLRGLYPALFTLGAALPISQLPVLYLPTWAHFRTGRP